ncbi:hypothetical protein V5735_09180 (plasmid) [Haladaptatus sp. SPP-AMP-3]|uniref:hypothetical protein n=1 Tax=Haladaptatus sp. SPP-AMP-3 TaxID=3121295 RepID=UPI003C2C22DF
MVSDENTGRETEEERITGETTEEVSEYDEERGEEGRREAKRRREEERPHPPAGPARYEGRRPPEGEYERPSKSSSYGGRYGSRVPKRGAEESDLSAREEREREGRAPQENEEEVATESSEEPVRESETGEIPKYGGRRDPNWKQQRRWAKSRQRQREEVIRRYERQANAALSRQRDLQVEKGGRRYHRGR